MNSRPTLGAQVATALGTAALTAFTPVAIAEGSASMQAPVVVSASRLPSTTESTSAVASVVTREAIANRAPASVIEVLRDVPGLHIDQPGGRGGVSSVYLRGADPNFTAVLVDGVKVNDPNNSRGGSFDFTTLDLGAIERIEVIRGPLSSVYGSDAIAGVINIITVRGASRPTVAVSAGLGSDGEQRAGVQARGPLGETMDYAVTASYTDSGTPTPGSEHLGREVVASLGASPSSDTSLRLTTRVSVSNTTSFPDDSGGPRFAVLRSLERRDIVEATVGAEAEHALSDRVQFRLTASLLRRDEEIDSPGVAPGVRDPFGIPQSTSDDRFTRLSFGASALVEPLPGLQLVAGADYQREDGHSDASLVFFGFPVPTSFDLDRDTIGAFAEMRYETAFGLSAEAGVRVDDAKGFSAEVSPRLGASWRIAATGTRLHASWGEGFKLPSFFALGNPLVGNPGLRPETSESYDIGVDQVFLDGRVRLGATWFHNKFFDIVDFDPGPPPRLVNRSEVRAEGFEVTAALELSDTLRLDGHVTRVDTDIVGVARDLRNRPEWRAGAGATWEPYRGLTLRAGLTHVGEVLDSSIATGDVTLGAYTRLDLAARWMVRDDIEVSLAVDNVLGEDYEEVVGFPSPGTQVRIAGRLRF
ncbi:MAG: TonB-dependent receptor [Chromatiales bacterium]|nr:TonB-dependent receptor [Chromatiales bacterium]